MADFVGDLQPPDVPASPELEGISCDMESLCFNLIDDKLWGIGIEILVLVYAFVGVAIVADAHLVPGLETLCVRWSIPEDVAGASFMAFGSAAPEITINAISTIKAVLSGAGLHPPHPPAIQPPASSLHPQRRKLPLKPPPPPLTLPSSRPRGRRGRRRRAGRRRDPRLYLPSISLYLPSISPLSHLYLPAICPRSPPHQAPSSAQA